MGFTEWTLTIIEWIGVVVFAVSGAIVAIQAEMDAFGVSIVGCITAIGGGVIRDILMGNLPPTAFDNIYTPIVAIISSIVLFVILYFNASKMKYLSEKLEKINNFFDAAGLALFTVTGVETACAAGFEKRAFYVVFLATVTGIGGGIFRDILVNQIPMVFKKRIYALASLFGALLYYAIRSHISKTTAVLIVVPAIVLIRLLAAKFKWKLPKVPKRKKETFTEADESPIACHNSWPI